MRIYLVGFMQSGKTTLGREVADRLHVPFFDLDELIERQAEMSIEEIFSEKGEYFFRDIELAVLHQTYAFDKSVIACGGGTPCFFDNMAWINQHGISIYLEWPLEKLQLQLDKEDTTRPLLSGVDLQKRKQFIADLFAKRKSFYEQASITIEMSGDQTKDAETLKRACRYIW